MNAQEALERDAKRFRTLMENFKSDHIWYHVFFDEDRKLGNSVGEVLDAIALRNETERNIAMDAILDVVQEKGWHYDHENNPELAA